MRVKIDFEVNEDVKHDEPITQAMTAYIYRMLKSVNAEYGNFLHEKGLTFRDKRFVYQSYALLQNNNLVQRSFKKGPATLIFSSVLDRTIEYFTEALMQHKNIHVYGHTYNIKNISLDPRAVKGNSFYTLSPICCVGPGLKWLNIPQTEEKAAELLVEKYYALYKKLPESSIDIKILNAVPRHMHFKKCIFRCYMGDVIIKAPADVVNLAYNGGLGARCGIGNGLLGQ